PAGVLAEWSVAAPAQPRGAGDLGVIWPASAAHPPVQTTSLQPGRAATYRLVVTQSCLYKVQLQVPSGSVAVLLDWDGGRTVLDPGSSQPINNYYIDMTPGVYWVQLTDVGSQPMQVWWTFRFISANPESIVGNGVGQASAVGLTLVTSGEDGVGLAPAPGA